MSLLAPVCVVAQKVTAEFDPAVDFSTFKTFAIREIKLASANPILNSELVRLWLASRSE